jgi:hypothetical protein
MATEGAMTQANGMNRPGAVGVVSILVLVTGLALIALGAAAAIFRDNSLVDLPVTLAQIDGSLPFDFGEDPSAYVAWAGLAIALAGGGLVFAGIGMWRGRLMGYLLALALVVLIGVVDVIIRADVTDDLLTWGADAALIVIGALLVLLLLLLLGRRARSFLLG